jgi:hypothetical protein
MKSVILLLSILSVQLFSAQTQREISEWMSKICTNDSVSATLGVRYPEKDSLLHFHFVTIDVEKYGLSVQEFNQFTITFETASQLLMLKVPYGRVHIHSYDKKNCQLAIEVSGAGNREALGLWSYVTFTFNLANNERWLIKDIRYHYTPYMGNTPANANKKGKK